MNHAWRLALRNLQRNARRNFATGAAIAFGFAGLVIVGGYILRVDRYLATSAVYLAHTGHVAIYKRDGIDVATTKPRKFSLSIAEQAGIAAALANDPNVEFSGRYLQGTGLIGNGCRAIPFVVLGAEPAAANFVRDHPQVRLELPELRKALRGLGVGEAKGNAVSLTSVLASRLGKPHVQSELPARQLGGPIDCEAPDARERIANTSSVQLLGSTFDGSFAAVEASFAGVHSTGLADTEDSSLLTSLSTVQSLFETNSVTYIGVFLKNTDELEAYASDLEGRLRRQGIPASVHTFQEERLSPFYAGSHAFLGVMAMFVGVIITSVIILSIIGSTTMTVIERSREIGSLRSIGFRRAQIRGLFVRETIALTALSVAAGLVLSLTVCAIVNAANIRYSPPGVSGDMQFMLHPDLALCVSVTALVLALACAGTLLAVRSRVHMKVADLNAAVVG